MSLGCEPKTRAGPFLPLITHEIYLIWLSLKSVGVLSLSQQKAQSLLFVMYFLFVQPEHSFWCFPGKQKVQEGTWFQSFFPWIPAASDSNTSWSSGLGSASLLLCFDCTQQWRNGGKGWCAANSSTSALWISARFAISQCLFGFHILPRQN